MILLESLLVVLIPILTILPVATSTCYNPDGTARTDPAYQPCNQVNGVISVYCGTNWTGGVVTPDVCEANGLCLNNDNGAPLYWRGSCTDKTWKSPLCLKNLCTDESNGGDPADNVAVSECDDGSWCCGGSNVTCCDKGLGVKIAATIGQSTSTSTSAKHSSTSSSTSGPPASLVSATDSLSPTITLISEEKKSSSKTGLAVGLGVRIPAFLAIIGAIAFFVLRNKKKKEKTDYVVNEMVGDEKKTPPDTMVHEAPAESVVHEMDATGPAELSAQNYPARD